MDNNDSNPSGMGNTLFLCFFLSHVSCPHSSLDSMRPMASTLSTHPPCPRFEATHCLNIMAMGTAYIAARRDMFYNVMRVGRLLSLPEEVRNKPGRRRRAVHQS